MKRCYLFLTSMICGYLMTAAAAVAQGQLEEANNNRDAVSGVFNNLRRITFETAEGNDLIVAIIKAGQWIGLALIGYYLARLGYDLLRGNRPWVVIGPFLVMIFAVQALIGSPGQTPSIIGLANGAWSLKDTVIQELFQRSINNVKINAAIEDNLKNVEAKNRVRRQLEVCRRNLAVPVRLPAKERPANPDPPLTAQQEAYYAQLECYQRVRNAIEQEKNQLEACGETCRGTRDSIERAATGLTRAIEIDLETVTRTNDFGTDDPRRRGAENADTGLIDGQFELDFISSDLIGNAISNAVIWIALKVHQLWLFLLYWSYFLGVMASPIALLMSITPILGQTPIAIWARFYVLTMLTEFWYVLAVGLSSIYQVLGGNGLDEVFYVLFLGILAPLIAVIAAGASGFKASGSLGGALAQTTGGAVSVATTFLRYR